MKEENQQLKETLGKVRWSNHEQVDTSNLHNQATTKTKEPAAATLSLRPSRAKPARACQEIPQANAWEDESKTTIAAKYIKPPKSADLDTTYLQYQRRETALSRSLFSAVLSLVVGTTVWTADDPCVPLVVALFTVVAISLRSVFQFFSTINNHPAIEAVALLSFNWFILGTLSYPTLPKVAHMFSHGTELLR